MEKELKMESWYNEPYHKIHSKRKMRLLNNKQKIILGYIVAGAIVSIVGLFVVNIIKLFN